MAESVAMGMHRRRSASMAGYSPQAAISVAQRLLFQLGAVNEQGALTATGRVMSDAGSDPRLAAMLCAAQQAGENALATAALLAAIIEEPPRGGNVDLRNALYHPQNHWQRRADQLCRRLGKVRGRLSLRRRHFGLRMHIPIVSPIYADKMDDIC